MNILLINIPLIFIYIYFIKKIKYCMHILQLESYKNERYIEWIKKNKEKILERREILLLISWVILLINNKIGSIIITIVTILLILSMREKKEKKPFVKTTRVKRLYATASLIYIILGVVYNLISYNLFLFIINLYVILSFFVIYIVNYINYPIEKSVQNKFYNKAKQKLENMPNLQVVGITGSYGKTSCKHILTTILEQKYNVLMTPGSYNTTMGVVRTINEFLKPTHQIFVCEMGAKCVGDIKEICGLVKPKYGMLTAIRRTTLRDI
ncbi:MAG: hypothetical protein IKT41_02950 [Clostridia bacterium]|nr:hypothetical protein [Clostridia bacterium]